MVLSFLQVGELKCVEVGVTCPGHPAVCGLSEAHALASQCAVSTFHVPTELSDACPILSFPIASCGGQA